MPRVSRIYAEDGIFHILTRGNNGLYVFKDSEDFAFYKKILKDLKNEQPFQLYHWCLMGNHVHLIIEANKKTELSKLMKRLNLLYFAYFKKRYGYAGHFWQDRFKSLLIEKENYLLACGLYIEKNPVKAKIVTNPKDYPHSSYNHYAHGKEDGLTDMCPCYNELGRDTRARELEYRRFTLDKEITSDSFKQLFLGTKEFVREMEIKFRTDNIRLKRGRPKKGMGKK